MEENNFNQNQEKESSVMMQNKRVISIAAIVILVVNILYQILSFADFGFVVSTIPNVLTAIVLPLFLLISSLTAYSVKKTRIFQLIVLILGVSASICEVIVYHLTTISVIRFIVASIYECLIYILLYELVSRISNSAEQKVERSISNDSVTKNNENAFTQNYANVSSNNSEQSAFRNDNNFVDPSVFKEMVTHILLLFFTFGIYSMIWVYRTTKYLNKCPNATQEDPTSKLLLCMFIPFYQIYWIYKHVQRIDKMNAEKFGINEDNTTLYIILAVFVPVVAFILMQDKINKLCVSSNIGQ